MINCDLAMVSKSAILFLSSVGIMREGQVSCHHVTYPSISYLGIYLCQDDGTTLMEKISTYVLYNQVPQSITQKGLVFNSPMCFIHSFDMSMDSNERAPGLSIPITDQGKRSTSSATSLIPQRAKSTCSSATTPVYQRRGT